MKLVIGNRNYSSWSMRAWVLLQARSVPFEEETIWLDTETARDEKLKYTPTARVPILVVDGFSIWDSLAIAEFVHERFPDAGIWPQDSRARARARSLCCEMHSSFMELRTEMPLNVRGRGTLPEHSDELKRDIERICAIWEQTPREFGGDSGFLFGDFCAADAFFAPVASRFLTYGVPPSGAAGDYWERLLSVPAVADWMHRAAQEEMVLTGVDDLLVV